VELDSVEVELESQSRVHHTFHPCSCPLLLTAKEVVLKYYIEKYNIM
jgi:hypothetical protein